MKLSDLRERLEGLGISFDSKAKAKELEALLADAPEETVEDALAEVSDGTNVVRTFSLELHGDSFRDLAEEFAKKKGLTVL